MTPISIPQRLLLPIFVAALLLQGCSSLLLNRGFPEHEGSIPGLPLHGPVEVLRDSWGIPYIYAEDEHDLMVAQGFVHAQDRLWQMETVRRLAQGRLSEIAGETSLMIDYFVRLLGLPQLRRSVVKALSQEERDLFQAYTDGVNAYLLLRGQDLPLEFRSLGLVPEPWTIEDLASFLALNAWFLQTNYTPELLSIKARSKLELKQWGDLFPSHPGADLPEDTYFQKVRHLKMGPFIPAALAFFDEAFPPKASGAGGSNNWVVARGQDGKPLLANDPHLALTVPGIWYFCHLDAPDMHAAGASLAGAPGIVIGHNDSVAWGLTNVQIDCTDLFVLRVDPDHPTRYQVDGRTLQMEREELRFGLPQGKSKSLSLFRTIYGPVITEVKKGIEAVVALKWYGTLPGEELTDYTFDGFRSLSRARNVEEALYAGRHIAIAGQNLVVADKEGHIGWHVTGAVPLRKGYSGRLPADGSSGTMNWAGFLPYTCLPSCVDPPERWIATANQRVVGDQDTYPLSFSWTAPYRYERIAQRLRELSGPSMEDFRRIQMDVHSLQADRILPRILSFAYRDEKAKVAAHILEKWDREVRSQSQGAAVYEVFLVEWVRTLLEDELGEDLPLYFYTSTFSYSIQDVILDRPDSPLWDRKDTLKQESPQEILEVSLTRTMDWLEKRLGPDREGWTWGRLHQVLFRHPGAKGCFTDCLLNRGPFPADGDSTTVNVGLFIPAQGEYRVFVIPSMRMIVPLGNLDQTQAIGPMGQSGQPGHPHYDDMIGPWMRGDTATLPFHRELVEEKGMVRLFLRP